MTSKYFKCMYYIVKHLENQVYFYCGKKGNFENVLFHFFLCPRIERSGAYRFTVVRLSVCPSVCTNLT